MPHTSPPTPHAVSLALSCALSCLAGATHAVAQDAATRFEPNQTRRTAARIAPGDYKGLFCNGDDWYAIPLPAGGRLEVSARFQHADGDLDLELHDPRGQLLGWSRGSRDEEVLAFDTAGEGTTVFLRVHNGTNAYELHVGVRPSDWQGDGRSNQIDCWGSDWYALDVEAGQQVRARVSFSHATGDLDLELVDRQGNQLAISSGREDQEALSWGASEDMAVLLHVYHVHRGRTPYALTVDHGLRPEEDLAEVFRDPRPEGAGNDRMELASGEILRGTILSTELRLVTPYTDLALPAERVAGVDLGSLPGGVHELVTTQGDRFSGFVRTGAIEFLLAGLDRPLVIRRERLRRLVFGRRGGERDAHAAPHSFVLRSGDQFRGELLGEGDWELDLDFARVPIPRAQVESFMLESDGSATILRRDQTATRGKLVLETLQVRLQESSSASQVIELHPSAFSLIQLAETEQAGLMRPAQQRHLIRRLAPDAPRELVEAVATGDAVASELGKLRPLVALTDAGNPELVRHVLALEDSEVAFAWFEILLRVDVKLRSRAVVYLSEAHKPEAPRNAVAECVVRLTSESGRFQTLEEAVASPAAANMIMQAANLLGAQQVQEWLMNRVRRFRNTRRTPSDPDARRMVVEELPRLLEER